MRGQGSTLGYLLWLLVVLGAGYHLVRRSADARPAIDARARRLASLERAVVAARESAKRGTFSPSGVRAALLAHGIQAQPLPAGRALARLSIRLSPEEHGELRVVTGSDERTIAIARGGEGEDVLELRALLRPFAER